MTIRQRIQRWLPSEERLRANRSLRWMGPLLRRPWLWNLSRRRVAAGAAIGVFFGFLAPVMQIAAAAGVALLLRANLPVAAVATLVSNPLTYVPIGVAAYQTGAWLLGEPVDPEDSKAQVEALAKEITREIETIDEEAAPPEPVHSPEEAGPPLVEPTPRWWQRLGHIGKPLMLARPWMAVTGAALTWVVVNLVWIVAVRLRRRRPRAKPVPKGRQP